MQRALPSKTWVSRGSRGITKGKIIVVGIFSINMAEKDGEIGSSKSEAGDGKPLETCDVDFGPH